MRRIGLLSLLLAAVLVGPLAGVTSAAPASGADRWALLVGVDRFQGRTRPLDGSVGDVNAMRDVLIRSGWRADHIRVLTDGAATATDIREGLRWLVDHSGPESFSLFWYSGHVKQVGSTEYLWPHDNQFIADREVAASMVQLRGWAWMNIAGCEAAGFDEGVSSSRRLVTGSSQANEKSYEHDSSVGRSVFGQLMVAEGMAGGAADANRDRRVSIHEAFAYAAERAPTITQAERQGAQHPYLAGGDGPEWFLDGTPPATPTVARRRNCILFCSRR